jgi:alkanesulfonate monooxygenase SsuD/methylene tetrahydromethanopterin reductase-like flavin-dependent oxidoreductase (luciferase family)
VPLHEPLRLAHELAMLDCPSNGRLISGFARGIPREYQVHNVPLKDSRARLEEAYEIVTRAWGEEIFTYQGQFWSYKDVAIWPRPVQKPGPEIWIPIVGSKESSEFVAKKNAVITPGLARGGLHPLFREVPRKQRPPDHATSSVDRAVGLCRRQQGESGQAMRALSPLFQPHAVQPRQLHRDRQQRDAGYVS